LWNKYLHWLLFGVGEMYHTDSGEIPMVKEDSVSYGAEDSSPKILTNEEMIKLKSENELLKTLIEKFINKNKE